MSKLAGVLVRNEASKFYPVSTLLSPDKPRITVTRTQNTHTHTGHYPSVMVRSNPVLSSGV